MPISVRLDPETEALLERLAGRRSQTKSKVIRDAIAALAEQMDEAAPGRPVELVSDLIGCVDDGPEDLSERTGARFRELLRRKSG